MRVDTLWGFFVCAQILVLVKNLAKAKKGTPALLRKAKINPLSHT